MGQEECEFKVSCATSRDPDSKYGGERRGRKRGEVPNSVGRVLASKGCSPGLDPAQHKFGVETQTGNHSTQEVEEVEEYKFKVIASHFVSSRTA